MCGITGIMSFEKPIQDLSVVRRMTETMSHRGPDSTGTFLDRQMAFGHNRLCIIDLSTAAGQPFCDASKRYYLVFNGEIYNFQEIKAQLRDYPFETTSDTEVLLAAFIRYGKDCLRHLKGMFSFAVWDRVENTLFAARDRMGVKPFYYFADDQYFIFASELGALIASGLVPKKINRNAVYDFLSYQSVCSPLSPIENVKQLEAGSYLVVRDGTIETERYWHIAENNQMDFDFDNISLVHEHTRTLLRNAVERRLTSDVPLGAFLSGGIDSSAIVGLMAEVSSTRPNTFNVGFEEEGFDESPYAQLIAKTFNTRHHTIILEPASFLNELTNALDAMDSPSGDGVNTYVVSKAIKRSGLKVALSGVGGDELFAGYPFFKKYLQLKKYEPLWSGTKWIREAATTVMGSSSRENRVRQLLKAPATSIRYFYPEFRRILTQEQLRCLTTFGTDMRATVDTQLLQFAPSLEDFPLLSQVSIAEFVAYTQNTLLKDTDQMSMAVSLEVREPFFDHELVEFVLNVPDKIKYPHYPKQLLVESLDGLLPEEIVHRKKKGFVFPWNLWMKKELREFCEAHLQPLCERDFINGEQLMELWRRFLKNDGAVRWMEIWLFVILEYWMEKYGIE